MITANPKTTCQGLVFFLVLFAGVVASLNESLAQTIKIENDTQGKKVTFGNAKMQVVLEYNRMAAISSLVINGEQVVDDKGGIYSGITTKDAVYSTLKLSKEPVISVRDSVVRLTGITYGDDKLTISEDWIFTLSNNKIKFDLDRSLSKEIVAEEVCFPRFTFKSINTWEGAYQDYGGLAWFYLFNKPLDTYGVHSESSKFWNSKSGNGLTIAASAHDKHLVMSYSRTKEDKLAYTVGFSSSEILPRFDSVTHRRRFIRDRSDVWSPIKVSAAKSRQTISLSYFDFNETYGRGKFVGINGEQVSALLNTIARIGVIDKNHFGGNSWHTPYGPICLHEQYIGQMGLAINDKSYRDGYQKCLDFYRDNAIKPDGRVWPRWAYSNEDAMPGVFTDKGFYEAQWGYLLDSNPDFVVNVVDSYDQTGDLAWIRTHQKSCEKALDWIINRDNNNNGLVEMMTDNMEARRGSDWIDIIWAAYENAFVNAKLYHALTRWASVEGQLGNADKQKYYNQFAQKLRSSFNKSTTDGGFWDEENKCYIHWRDKNGSIHGRNMVTPVNFMAIAYGIIDNESRGKQILDDIETGMQKENLFFWPLCMKTYGPGEGNDWQFPFPNYENGDIFLSWGSIAVKAYADYKPELALKYVKNVLSQYSKDGLAFQRYGRAKQDGLGDDILSGNCLSAIGLYQAIYGINPLYNRFYLNPHITEQLAGTQLKYNYRDQQLTIDLAMNKYAVSNGQFRISDKNDFGFYSSKGELAYFRGNSETASLKISTDNNLALEVKTWDQDQRTWTQSSKKGDVKKATYQLNNLKGNNDYVIAINNKAFKTVRSDGTGSLTFEYKINTTVEEFKISGK